MSLKGKFITLEGSEGAGKSTNLVFLCDLLRQANIDFYETDVFLKLASFF